MTYRLEYSDRYIKQAKKLDKATERLIAKWLYKNIHNSEDPKMFGKPLRHDLKNKWRYRIGNYRVICSIEDDSLIVLALEVAHRKDIYKR